MPVSQRQFAKHLGVDPMVVGRGIRKGRLKTSVVFDASGKPLGVTSIEEAALEWAANSDYTDAPQRAPGADDTTAQAGMSLSEASAVEKVWKAKSAEIAFRTAAGELVDAAEVTNRFTTHVVGVRNKLASLPSRAKQQLPHLSLADIAALEIIVREALDDVAAEEIDADD